MSTPEELFKAYTKEICSICINKDKCQEELRIITDNSIKCPEYKTTFVPREVDSLQFSTKW